MQVLVLLSYAVLTSLKALCEKLVKSLCKPKCILSLDYPYVGLFLFQTNSSYASECFNKGVPL